MGLFDIFTGDAYKDAAAQQRQYFDQLAGQTTAAIGDARTSGLSALQSGQYGALGSLGSGFGSATGAISGATNPALGALTSYGGQATGALTGAQAGGLDALTSGVNSAVGAYGPYADFARRLGLAGGGTSEMFSNALGLNGPGGNAAATAAFQAGPGFQFQLGKGVDAIARAANASGMAASGNTLRSAQEYGQGLANQEYNNWLSNLRGREGTLGGLESGALGGVAGGLSNAYLSGGRGAADIFTGTGGKLADVFSGLGSKTAGVYTGQAGTLADLFSKQGISEADVQAKTGMSIADLERALSQQQATFSGQLAPTYGNTYSQEAAAETGGSANLWNLFGSLAKTAAGGGTPQLPGSGPYPKLF